MKGILTKPHYLQGLILSFSLFFMLSSVTLYTYQSAINCHYSATNYEDESATNDEYHIKCVGNAITAVFYGLTGLMILIGFAVSYFSQHDSDYLISFVIFGILTAYTSDVCTNLRVNCVAGDTTSLNTFDDDSYDSAAEKCVIFTYGLIGGLVGCVGGFAAGFYAVLMKITGKFYIQRPAGLFIALAGYAAIFSLNNLAAAEPLCHYYDSGSDMLPLPAPSPPITDDLVNNQLHPLCIGYTNTAIGYGTGSALAVSGIFFMYFFQKRGMWFVFATMCGIMSLSNSFTFTGAKLSFCDAGDNYLSKVPGLYSDYQNQMFDDSCVSYGHAVTVSYIATSCAFMSSLISIFDLIFHIDHDTFRIRLRRALLFGFGGCFSVASLFTVHSTSQSDCALYHDELSDDTEHNEMDNSVQRLQCEGKNVQILFYLACLGFCFIGCVASLVCNFPQTFDAECLADFEVVQPDDDYMAGYAGDDGDCKHFEEQRAKLLDSESNQS